MQVTKPTSRHDRRGRYDAVIFDLDGTLADTFPTVLRIFNRIVRERTGRHWTLEELLPYFGPPETQILRNLFPEEEVHQQLIEDFFRLSAEDGDEIRAFPGLAELLTDLSLSGTKLGVYSGASTRSARIRVGHAGLIDHFTTVLGGDEVLRYKPHPEGLLRILDEFKVRAESSIFIGDMVADILAGRRAGMKTAAVTWGAGKADELRASEPDFLVAEVAGLETILFE